ncbi:pyridoxamine 5'-phosphate oxidase family protein [bacterium]|nr:MAG: pyridoxamine 5'-phosphate oxidase family protein [bacterium]
MNNPDLKSIITEYLAEAKMMQLATVSAGKPWICNVWFAADSDMNIYWFSATNRRHSLEIAADPHVAAAICLPRGSQDADRGGLQIEGTGQLLTKPSDIAKATKHYLSRKIFNVSQVKNFMAHLDRPHRFYKLTPDLIVLFDTVHFPENPRQEFRLQTHKND